MKKRDYRPYCFDSCNEPLKTRHQQLLDAIHNIKVPEVKAKVDEKQLNDAVSKAIKENPVKVEVEVDDKVIVESIQKDLCKVHSHITRAENEIIETLSCNCDGGCGCGGSDCKCGNKKECNCASNQITKDDLIEAVNRVNSHTDHAVDSIEVPTVSEIKETVQKVVAVVDAKVETLAEKTEEYFGEVESMVEEVKADVKEIKEKVEETETKVDDFKALYESYHD